MEARPSGTPHLDRPARSPDGVGIPDRLAGWSAAAVLVWSSVTVGAALAWSGGLLDHPFTDRGAVAIGAVLNAAPPEVGTVFTAVLGLLGIGLGMGLWSTRGGGRPGGSGVEALGWGLAVTVVATLLHGKALSMLGYTPVVLALGWFDRSLVEAYLDALADPESHLQIHALVGVVLLAWASLVHRRTRRGRCPACGRTHGWSDARETEVRLGALRRSRTAVAVAAVAAMIYPALRLPWLLGVPIGIDAETFAELQATPGMVETGIGLGLAAVAGIALMVGLVQDWGVRFPRWAPGLAGRRVPISLAVLPAAIVSLALVAMGRGSLTALVTGQLSSAPTSDWVHVLAFSAMLPWGVALGVATEAYVRRRRGRCTTCGQGAPEWLPSQLRSTTLGAAPARPRR